MNDQDIITISLQYQYQYRYNINTISTRKEKYE